VAAQAAGGDTYCWCPHWLLVATQVAGACALACGLLAVPVDWSVVMGGRGGVLVSCGEHMQSMCWLEACTPSHHSGKMGAKAAGFIPVKKAYNTTGGSAQHHRV
jgi:hypothetical protein